MIYSVVSMMIKPGRMEEFLEECRKIRPLVLKEQGCLMYDYTRELAIEGDRHEAYNPDRITLYEKWSSPEALEEHNSMEYMKSFVEKVAPLRNSVLIRTGTELF